jgi:murein DD-endopeptidase MepM/ murein hydrolase activator NlpD
LVFIIIFFSFIFCAVSCSVCFSFHRNDNCDVDYKISCEEENKRNLLDKIAEKKHKIEKNGQKIQAEQATSSRLAHQINKTESQIHSEEERVKKLSLKIKILEKNVQKFKKKAEENRQKLENLLVFVQKSGEGLGIVQFICSSGNMGDLLHKLEVIFNITKYYANLVEQSKSDVETLLKEQYSFENKKEELELYTQKLASSKKNLENIKRGSDNIIEFFSDTEKILQEGIRKKEEEIKQTDNKINAYFSDKKKLEENQKIIDEENRRKRASAENWSTCSEQDQEVSVVEQNLEFSDSNGRNGPVPELLVVNKSKICDVKSTEGNGFAWPVPGFEHRKNITSFFGLDDLGGAKRFHRGLDISGSDIGGSDIVAIETGVIAILEDTCKHDYGKSGSCGCGGGYGKMIAIDHGEGLLSFYGHCRVVHVKVGDLVHKKQVIGKVGSTGFSTGSHLHFEIRRNGKQVDPLEYYPQCQ